MRRGGSNRTLIAVLIVQVLIATLFVVLVATDSIPLPSASATSISSKLLFDA
ncbi:MAG: hypothetical protein WCL20_07780 [Actinomycetes bacterium]